MVEARFSDLPAEHEYRVTGAATASGTPDSMGIGDPLTIHVARKVNTFGETCDFQDENDDDTEADGQATVTTSYTREDAETNAVRYDFQLIAIGFQGTVAEHRTGPLTFNAGDSHQIDLAVNFTGAFRVSYRVHLVSENTSIRGTAWTCPGGELHTTADS